MELGKLYLLRLKSNPKQVLQVYKSDGNWKTRTLREFDEWTRRYFKVLQKRGLSKGDRVLIVGDHGPDGFCMEWAILALGGIPAFLHASIASDDLIALTQNHPTPNLFWIVCSKSYAKGLDPTFRKRIVIDGAFTDEIHSANKQASTQKSLREFEMGLLQEREGSLLYSVSSGHQDVPHLYSLNGTNIMSAIEDCSVVLQDKFKIIQGDRLFVLNPLSYFFSRIIQFLAIQMNFSLVYPADLLTWMDDMKVTKPSFIWIQPHWLEKAHRRWIKNLEIGGFAKQKVVDWALETTDKKIGNVIASRWLRSQTGKKLRGIIVGGGTLSQETARFLERTKIQVIEQYGLAESSGIVSLQKPLKEVAIKIAPDGEIFIQSKKLSQDVAKILRENKGWYPTGDIGNLDASGVLHIWDRKQDLILREGARISPNKVEQAILQAMLESGGEDLIRHVLVVGHRKDYLTALITLDRHGALEFARRHQILFSDFARLANHPKVRLAVHEWVEKANKGLPPQEQVKKFVVIPDQFSQESGELSSSQILRRDFIARKFRRVVRDLYS